MKQSVWLQIAESELPRAWSWRLGMVHSGEAVSATAVNNVVGIYCEKQRVAAPVPTGQSTLAFF